MITMVCTLGLSGGSCWQAFEASRTLLENLREEQQITLSAWSCRQQLIASHRQVRLLWLAMCHKAHAVCFDLDFLINHCN